MFSSTFKYLHLQICLLGPRKIKLLTSFSMGKCLEIIYTIVIKIIKMENQQTAEARCNKFMLC